MDGCRPFTAIIGAGFHFALPILSSSGAELGPFPLFQLGCVLMLAYGSRPAKLNPVIQLLQFDPHHDRYWHLLAHKEVSKQSPFYPRSCLKLQWLVWAAFWAVPQFAGLDFSPWALDRAAKSVLFRSKTIYTLFHQIILNSFLGQRD